MTDKQLPLPHWFEPAFKHLDKKEYQQMADIYRQEPLLQELCAELDKQNPLFRKITRCLYCHATHFYITRTAHTLSYQCASCERAMSSSTQTLFYFLAKEKYPKLYALLVTLWCQAIKEKILALANIGNRQLYEDYQTRLKPIIDLTKGKIVTANPRYLHGFTPQEQGVTCRYCSSTHVDYVLHYPQDNPELICRACHKYFFLYPHLSPKETPKEKTIAQLSPPKWFQNAFAHAPAEQYTLLVGIWSEETALRDLIDMIDAQNPDLDKSTPRCPICHNLGRKNTPKYSWLCTACHKYFSKTQGTVFSHIQSKHFIRIYTTAVMLWTPYTLDEVMQLCHIPYKHTVINFHKRLRPLVNELLEDRLPTDRPRHLLGFTLGKQGIRCKRCQSDNVTAHNFKRGTDNPTAHCHDCNKDFRLHYLRGKSYERAYTTEFRKKVLLTLEQEGLRAAETAKRFDIHLSTLHRWIREAKQQP